MPAVDEKSDVAELLKRRAEGPGVEYNAWADLSHAAESRS
jgi:hypothetical protein